MNDDNTTIPTTSEQHKQHHHKRITNMETPTITVVESQNTTE